ncbi:MAG: insulinase family protein, partial [Myxococcota bacterium]
MKSSQADVLDEFHRAAHQSGAAGLELLDARRVRRSIRVGRYRFKNGLTVVAMLDPRAPVFSYQTWMRVGSKHESPERTGLAHLLEHLMFKATHRHASGTLDRELELRGADTNAATWVDWTYYHETLAARGDNLERVAELESDRLRNLVLTRETFEPELEVVMNERTMTVEDSALGGLNESIYLTAFT